MGFMSLLWQLAGTSVQTQQECGEGHPCIARLGPAHVIRRPSLKPTQFYPASYAGCSCTGMLQDMTHQALTCLRAPAADPDEWDEQTMLNLAAPMRLTRHLVPTMARSWALVQHSRT